LRGASFEPRVDPHRRFASRPKASELTNRAEAARVAQAIAGSRAYVGRQATERAFKSEGGDYRVLHFATHFLSDDRQPLYSRIVLSQQDEDEEDGYLQTYEIFNTHLNADLVVLSACNTGLGKLSKGEGLVGISRAFLYPGVPSLVVSLWSVDDEATSELMESFYHYVRSGMNKRQALRRAKLDYLEAATDRGRDPFFWAPFILVGDGSLIRLSAPPFETTSRLVVATVVGLLVALFLVASAWLVRGPRSRRGEDARAPLVEVLFLRETGSRGSWPGALSRTGFMAHAFPAGEPRYPPRDAPTHSRSSHRRSRFRGRARSRRARRREFHGTSCEPVAEEEPRRHERNLRG
jgi:hypothetical protein